MKLFNFHINSDKEIQKFKGSYETAITDAKYNSDRPSSDPWRSQTGDLVRVPFYPLNLGTLYDVALYSDVVRTIIQTLKKEIFRKKPLLKEKFSKKCLKCDKEFDSPVERCDEEDCNGPVRDPDKKQKQMGEVFLDNINDNKQNVTELSEQVNDDLEIIDDAYMIAMMDYYWNSDGTLLGGIPTEIIRGHPFYMRVIADKGGKPARTTDGKIVLFCLEHRNEVVYNIEKCKHCEKTLVEAWYRSEDAKGKYIYYGKDEVLHKSKYMPSLIYGVSNLIAGWQKIVTLMNQDSYILKYYTKQRPPRGMLFVNTPNMESLTKAWQSMLAMFKKDPHMIPPFGVDQGPQGGRGKFVEFIDFMRSLDEMEFTETRNEFVRKIGALYGVMPLFQADLSQAGGLNNEGLQITITNRAIEDGQEIFNEGYYPWIMRLLKITDYVLELPLSEEKDEMAKEVLNQQKITNARQMQAMGYEVTLTEDNQEDKIMFEYSPTEVPVENPTPSDGDSMGGLPIPSSSSQNQQPSARNPISSLSGSPDKNMNKFKVKKVIKKDKVYQLE